jgi:ABC-2 type transport system permease protein
LPAVDGVTLSIKAGELFGLLGPNGAGKTTLIKVLCTLIQPTSGVATINGYDLTQEYRVKSSVGLMTSDERSFYWRLTGRQNLEFFGRLHHIPHEELGFRIEEAIDFSDLTPVADKRFNTYSTGMRQRLAIARAILHNPSILFLDEPARGLDPESIIRLHKLIRQELVDRKGITVFLTTHDLVEAESLCDRIALMNQGRITACGTIPELRTENGADAQASFLSVYSGLIQKTHSYRTNEDDPLQPSTTKSISKKFSNPSGLTLPIAAAFIKRDLLTELSYPISFLLQFVTVLFSTGVFYFISRLLGNSIVPSLSAYGGDYFSFVLIGIAFGNYFGVGLSSFANNLRQAQTTGTLEAMLSTPTTIPAIILGSTLWDYLLTTFKVIVYLAIGTLFLHARLGEGNYLAAAVILLLTILAFSSIGIVAASFIMVLKRGDPITWLFNVFSSLLGGVYYPLDVLPSWMQWLAGFLPITYALQAMRMALLQGKPLQEMLAEVFALIVFSFIFLPVSLITFRLAVRQAKIDGSLAHY